LRETWPLPTGSPLVQPRSCPQTQKQRTGCSKWSYAKNLSGDVRHRREAYQPFNATVFFRTDWMAWSGITVLPPFRTGVTLTSSHWMGT
jgi:hypothetical protein